MPPSGPRPDRETAPKHCQGSNDEGRPHTGDFTIETYPGPHRVEVYADNKESRPVGPDDPPELAFTLTSLIPERFNKKSTRTCDVQFPKDRPEFVLTIRKE